MMNRRHFLRASGLSIAGLGIGQQASAETNNNKVLLTVFLRGGVEGMSLVQPRPGNNPRRTQYEQWRRPMTRVRGSLPLAGSFGMHPAFANLRHAFTAGDAGFVAAVGGARENRSHFEQMNLVEFGSRSSGAALREGLLGRAFQELTPVEPGLARLALNTQANLRLSTRNDSALSAPDLRSFAALENSYFSSDPRLNLKERLNRMYLPAGCSNDVCDAGRQAYGSVGAMEDLKAQANLPNGGGTSLPVLLGDMADLISKDSAGAFRFLSLDVGGWDTHVSQGNDDKTGSSFNGDLARKLESLSYALARFYDRLRTLGQWSRVTILVITEFGRTARDNGGAGTDHGYGGTALVLGRRVAQPLVSAGYFPVSRSNQFYARCNSTHAMPIPTTDSCFTKCCGANWAFRPANSPACCPATKTAACVSLADT